MSGPAERFPSTYGCSLADLLAALLQQGGGSRLVDREQLRQSWRLRYPEAAARSIRATRRRRGASVTNDSIGTTAKGSLNQAYRALEQAGAIERRDEHTVAVISVQSLVAIARQYRGSDAAFSSGHVAAQGDQE